MTTDVDICNRALSSIRARSSIASLNENSPEARQCTLLYKPTLFALLRGAHWNFARATAYLTLYKAQPGTPQNTSEGTNFWEPATQPPPGWLYEYYYPEDCLAIRYISQQWATGQTGGVPIFSTPTGGPWPPATRLRPQRFQPATDKNPSGQNLNVVLCNVERAITIYTKKIEEPDLWDDLFQEAMVAALSTRLVLPVAGDITIAREQKAYAADIVKQARVSDGNEGLTIENWTPEWLAIRGYAADWVTPGPGSAVGSWGGLSFLGI